MRLAPIVGVSRFLPHVIKLLSISERWLIAIRIRGYKSCYSGSTFQFVGCSAGPFRFLPQSRSGPGGASHPLCVIFFEWVSIRNSFQRVCSNCVISNMELLCVHTHQVKWLERAVVVSPLVFVLNDFKYMCRYAL